MSSNEPPLSVLRTSLNAYLDGETGVRFDVLARFAEPLFELYQVDLRSSLDRPPTERDRDELATLLAVLETARLLWAFFVLDAEARSAHMPALEEQLLGPDPDPEERRSFLQLLALMQSNWEALVAEEAAGTSTPGYRLPSFEQLLRAYHAPAAVPANATGYGTDELEPAAALAVFARPLLDDPPVMEDPDRLEEALERANAYWHLAQASAAQYREQLEAIKQRFATTNDEAAAIETEAATMTARFAELFPEQIPR